jgi:hypothetical protein
MSVAPTSRPTELTAAVPDGVKVTAKVRPMEDQPDATGSVRYVNGTNPGMLADARRVLDARRYTVTLKLSDCQDGRTYHWFIRAEGPRGGFTLTAAENHCAGATIDNVPTGEWDVTAKEFDGGSLATVSTAKIKVGTRIVAGLGESYAAGEGLPPYNDAGCHRSEFGLQGRIADVASADVPVMFFHLACSGANTVSMFNPGRAPLGGAPIDSQFADLQKVIDTFGVPDAVLLSNGGNDVPYTSYVFQCGAVQNPGCDPTNPGLSERTADIKAHLDAGLAATRANYDLFAQCLNTASGGGTLSVPAAPPNSADMSQMERQDVAVTCPLRTPVPADRVLMTGYPNGFTGPDGYCSSIHPPIVSLNAQQSRWLDENFVRPFSTVTQEVAAAKGWHYVATYDAFAGHGTCATGADQWIFGLLGAGPTEPRGSWHPTEAGADRYGVLAGPTLAEMLAVTGPVTQRHTQILTVCHDKDSPSATVTLRAGNAAVDRDRLLTLRTTAGQANVVLRGDRVEYKPTLPVDPDVLGLVKLYDADVSMNYPTLTAEIPEGGCNPEPTPPPNDPGPGPEPTGAPQPPPPPPFTCPPTGRPAGGNPARIPAGGPGPADQTVTCDLAVPMVLLANAVHTSHYDTQNPPDNSSTSDRVVADMDDRYLVIPAGHLSARYRSVHKTSGYLYDGTALELTVTDAAGQVLLRTVRDLFRYDQPNAFYPMQVVDAATLVEMHHADEPEYHRWWLHTVITHWFAPYCEFSRQAVAERPDSYGNRWVNWNGQRYFVHATGVFGESGGASCS